MKLVRAKWLDAFSAHEGWHTLDSLRETRPVECETVGYLLVDDPKFVTIVATISQDGGGSGHVTIPRGMLVGKLRVLSP